MSKSKSVTVYKLVHRTDDPAFWISFNLGGKEYRADGIRRGLVLPYAVGLITQPTIPGTKLFAFSTCEAALTFGDYDLRSPDFALFEAIATGVIPGGCPKILSGDFRNLAVILSSYQAAVDTAPEYLADKFVLCDSIKLVCRVKIP